MTHQLHTIKSQDDCSEFLGWLQEHPEIERVQGWYCVRADSNRVKQFANTPNGEFGTAHWAVCEWMYSERRSFNDWIRTYSGVLA